MLTTILEETINGWIFTVYNDKGKQVFIYERYVDAFKHRYAIEQERTKHNGLHDR